MELRLVAMIKGRPYYEVVVDQRSVFTGSLAECRRFERLHEEKEIESRRDKRRLAHTRMTRHYDAPRIDARRCHQVIDRPL